MIRLNRDGHTALYLQIAQKLLHDIETKKLLPLEKLPSEYELTQLFDVSRVTVRQAIRVLVDQGLVVSRQGKGVFVSGPKVNQELKTLRGFYDSLVAQGYDPKTELIEFEPPRDIMAADGQVAALGNVLRFTRVYRVDDAVVAIAQCTMSCFGVEVSRGQVEANPVYAVLHDIVKRKVASASTSILAVRAPSGFSELLSLGEEAMSLLMDRTSFDEEGLILERTRFYIQPEIFAFQLEVSGPMQISSSIRKVS